ncbi:TRAP transporter large permease, partial [Chloroflexota bacterium]
MENMAIVITIIVLLFILLATGLPIFACLGFCGAIGLYWLDGLPGLATVGATPFYSVYHFTLIAVPLFIFMGEILNRSQMAAMLYNLGNKWVGGFPGGLAMASVVACAIFAAMCGSAIAGAATIGMIAIPEMTKRGYDKSLATGTLATAGPLAILIPPSIVMILYGTIAEVSIGSLFMAGFIPGAILALLMMLYIGIHCTINPRLAPKTPHASWGERFSSLKMLWAPLALIIMVMGSIYGGITTPTEAAAFGVIGVLLISTFAYRTLTLRKFWEATLGTIKTTSMIFMIIVCAKIFSHFVIMAGLAMLLKETVLGLGPSPYLVLIFLNLICMVLGCFLDPLGIMYVTLP